MDQRDPQTYAIIGACMEVHQELGHGFLEAVYQAALQREFSARGIPFAREVKLQITYKDQPLECWYEADFVCYGEVIVELKALAKLSTVEHAQIINYLRATGLNRGLLVNFGTQQLEYKRFVRSAPLKSDA
jgi:GxxExxY protein